MEEQPVSQPHSKTTVLHIPWKTRLHCNHLQPKCRCSAISNRKRTAKQNRSKPGPVRAPKQILVSSRTLPRGTQGDRKHYPESSSDPPTVVSGSWQPSRGTSGKSIIKRGTKNKPHVSKASGDNSATAGTNNVRKKVHFAGKSSSESEKEDDVDHSVHKQQSAGQTTISHDRSRDSTDLSEPRHSEQESSDSDGGYCKLCETGGYSPAQASPPTRQYSYSTEGDSCPYTSHVDSCHLCNSYRTKNHYDGESHGPRSPFRTHHSPSHTHHSPSCTQRSPSHISPSPSHTQRSPSRTPPQEAAPAPRHKKSYLQRKTSTPELSYSLREPGERRIPYEPRTQLVRDLKHTLEADTAGSAWVGGSSSKENRRAWVMEDLDAVCRPRPCHNQPDLSVPHKCVHRYLQNDRLFLEPTVTNKRGQSVCSECGAPQPQDPHTDPYLYHITLGGLKERSPSQSRNNVSGKTLHDSGTTSNTNQSLKSKVLYDPSKHIFAKLKSNVDNVLPKSSGYVLNQNYGGRTKYRVNPQFKRPPSSSMALVDHLL